MVPPVVPPVVPTGGSGTVSSTLPTVTKPGTPVVTGQGSGAGTAATNGTATSTVLAGTAAAAGSAAALPFTGADTSSLALLGLVAAGGAVAFSGRRVRAGDLQHPARHARDPREFLLLGVECVRRTRACSGTHP